VVFTGETGDRVINQIEINGSGGVAGRVRPRARSEH